MNTATNHFDPQADVPVQPFLAADVGGTHARVALVRAVPSGDGGLDVLAYRKFICADYPALADLLRAFIDSEVRGPVRHCVLACAGQVLDDEVLQDNLILQDNLAWPIQLSQLRSALDFEHVAVLNDFEALGHALDGSLAGSGRLLCGPDVHARGPALVIGPGTGLGAAVRLADPAGARVLTTEAGQMDFAPHSLRDREVLACLAPQGGYVAYERLLSGPGLLTLYTILCRLQGATLRFATPEAVTEAAVTISDALAVEAVEMFCAMLGSFAGSLAMTFMASGGVYLAGGFLYSMFGSLERSAFAERFLHDRSVRQFLARIPVRVVEHGRHGVLGAANWYLKRAASETASAQPVETFGVAV